MKTVRQKSRFKRDFKLLPPDRKRRVAEVVQMLRTGVALPPSLHPHSLTGDFYGWDECHAQPDLLLLYCLSSDEVLLYRVGSHSHVFG